MTDEKHAEAGGYDAAISGPNTRNCHFSLFATPALTAAWERGNARGKSERNQPLEKAIPHAR